jgi:hypothetical protein
VVIFTATMDAASARIVDKLWQRTLPTDEPVKTWGAPGSGGACDGCDLVVTSKESEHEIDAERTCPPVSYRVLGTLAGLESALPAS